MPNKKETKLPVDILALDENGAYLHSVEEMENFITESNVRIMEHQKEIERLNKLCFDEANKQHKVDAVISSFDTKEAKQRKEAERLAAYGKSQEEDALNKANKLKKIRELSQEV